MNYKNLKPLKATTVRVKRCPQCGSHHEALTIYESTIVAKSYVVICPFNPQPRSPPTIPIYEKELKFITSLGAPNFEMIQFDEVKKPSYSFCEQFTNAIEQLKSEGYDFSKSGQPLFKYAPDVRTPFGTRKGAADFINGSTPNLSWLCKSFLGTAPSENSTPPKINWSVDSTKQINQEHLNDLTYLGIRIGDKIGAGPLYTHSFKSGIHTPGGAFNYCLESYYLSDIYTGNKPEYAVSKNIGISKDIKSFTHKHAECCDKAIKILIDTSGVFSEITDRLDYATILEVLNESGYGISCTTYPRRHLQSNDVGFGGLFFHRLHTPVTRDVYCLFNKHKLLLQITVSSSACGVSMEAL